MSGGGTRRQAEVEQVDEHRRHLWLAGQIDEVEDKLVRHVEGLSSQMGALTTEMATTRDDMHRNTNRVVWTVATGAISLLVSTVAIVLTMLLTAR